MSAMILQHFHVHIRPLELLLLSKLIKGEKVATGIKNSKTNFHILLV